mgnify:CR=1 FL=1
MLKELSLDSPFDDPGELDISTVTPSAQPKIELDLTPEVPGTLSNATTSCVPILTLLLPKVLFQRHRLQV